MFLYVNHVRLRLEQTLRKFSREKSNAGSVRKKLSGLSRKNK